MDVWRVRVGFRVIAKNAVGIVQENGVGAELGHNLTRFSHAEFEFDAAGNTGVTDVFVEGRHSRWGTSDAESAAATAAGIVADVAAVVLGVREIAVETTVIGEPECINGVVVWGDADHDAPIPDSERHRFLRRRGVFGDRLSTEERRARLDRWRDDVDVKTGITAGF